MALISSSMWQKRAESLLKLGHGNTRLFVTLLPGSSVLDPHSHALRKPRPHRLTRGAWLSASSGPGQEPASAAKDVSEVISGFIQPLDLKLSTVLGFKLRLQTQRSKDTLCPTCWCVFLTYRNCEHAKMVVPRHQA